MAGKAKAKSVEDYLSEPYMRVIFPDPEDPEYYFARVLELPGCVSQGKTPEEAYRNIEDAMEGWIEVALQRGQHIPRSLGAHEFSGQIPLRIEPSLHHTAAVIAEAEGVSVNQLVQNALASRVAGDMPGSLSDEAASQRHIPRPKKKAAARK